MPPSDEFIQEPGRFDVLDLMGGRMKKEDGEIKNGIDIRKVIDKGINSKNIVVRGTTQIVKFVYDSGIILGSALGNENEEGKK